MGLGYGFISWANRSTLNKAENDEDSVYAPLLGRQELQENVGIYLEDNYEQISVPVPEFGGSDPADIIHDFHRVWGDLLMLPHLPPYLCNIVK